MFAVCQPVTTSCTHVNAQQTFNEAYGVWEKSICWNLTRDPELQGILTKLSSKLLSTDTHYKYDHSRLWICTDPIPIFIRLKYQLRKVSFESKSDHMKFLRFAKHGADVKPINIWPIKLLKLLLFELKNDALFWLFGRIDMISSL